MAAMDIMEADVAMTAMSTTEDSCAGELDCMSMEMDHATNEEANMLAMHIQF